MARFWESYERKLGKLRECALAVALSLEDSG